VRADGVAEYQTSKWKAEEAVRQSGIPFCILRPSLIFGPGDGFVTQMLGVMRKALFIRPVPGDGRPKFRPVSINDVTFCFARALTTPEATGRTIDLGGADELSLDEILREIATVAGVRKTAFHVPLPIMFAVASVAQAVLPSPPVTTGQLKMLREGSTCDPQPMMRIFSVHPAGFREGLRAYLGQS
jgi:NADH dehydrogenase